MGDDDDLRVAWDRQAQGELVRVDRDGGVASPRRGDPRRMQRCAQPGEDQGLLQARSRPLQYGLDRVGLRENLIVVDELHSGETTRG